MKDQRAELDWQGDVPVARAFDDPYFSFASGLSETRHVFLDGNDLPARFRDGFHIAELGFGTGLNLLATLALWHDSGVEGQFQFTSFEAFPMGEADRMRALEAFEDLADWAERLGSCLCYDRPFEVGGGRVQIITGDARSTLRQWPGLADAWFLDGFSPAKNPELWEPPLLAEVARHTAVSGTFATYTAAGAVRRALDAAGFEVARQPGYGRKRHMSVGRMR